MDSKIISFVKGIMAGSIFFGNSIFWCVLIYLVAIPKLFIPLSSFRGICSRLMVGMAENWVTVNNLGISLLHSVRWQVTGIEGLEKNKSYLVFSNHSSWVDIVVLQKIFNRRIPFLRFFLKQELIWVPFLGLAWWALDFPFMKRYSKEYLAKHPEKRGEDLKTTKAACEKYQGDPISVINFLEGTRFTKKKHQGSSFKNLLKPKSGGLAFVIESMGSQFSGILDVTIYYPRGDVSLWDLLSGRISEIKVLVRQEPLPAHILHGSYLDNEEFRIHFQNWVLELWKRKDQDVEALRG